MTDETRLRVSSPSRRPWQWLIMVAVLAAVIAGLPSFGAGYVFGLLHGDTMRGEREVQRVRQILADNPARFDALEINRGPADKFLLEGTVDTQADLEFLREAMIREFGRHRAERIVAVTVRDESEPAVDSGSGVGQ